MDFGHPLVKPNGLVCKVAFLVMALPYSDAGFVQAFERECTETFWEGHVQAFGFFGGLHARQARALPDHDRPSDATARSAGWVA